MAEPKTKKNDADVEAFLEKIEHPQKKEDAFRILQLMAKVSKSPAAMWGDAIIGYGSYHYVYASGREGDWMRIGFSPRKTNFSLYIMSGFSDYDDLLADLGKYKTGKSCLYINKLADVDIKVLEKLLRASLAYMNRKYPQ